MRTQEAAWIGEKVRALASARVVLNLGGVDYVDSAGLGELVGAYTTVTRAGGKMKLLNVTKKMRDLLSITKLLTVFETFDSEQDAVKSFN